MRNRCKVFFCEGKDVEKTQTQLTDWQVDLEGSESGPSPEDPKVSRVLTYEGVLVSPMEEVGFGMRFVAAVPIKFGVKRC